VLRRNQRELLLRDEVLFVPRDELESDELLRVYWL